MSDRDDATLGSGAIPEWPPSPETAGPRWIAGFRVIRKLGEGGMGVVYEVEQQNPRRSVALKVIRGGAFVDEHTLRLFHREVVSLARLKHAGIAAIHEAGRTDDGQPFFIMELVQGVPLDEHLHTHPLRGAGSRDQIHERLVIFRLICDAIHYAHQKGVIHRDLKPGNIILVTEREAAANAAGATTTLGARPEIKILDFGLARIVDPEIGAATAMTEVGRIQGSLSHMSPEQASGRTEAMDVRTDVYSLGVILYEMLTDEPPYRTEGLLIHDAMRAITEEPPRKPSAIWRHMPGELETIVLKALEKDPAQRYQTVLALAEDIERYLTNQPILARPPSTAYQVRKLIGRHKVGFAFAVTLLVLVTGFGVTMSIMYEVQRRAKERAVVAQRKTEQINGFLQTMLRSADPEKARGREVTVREVLEGAAGTVDSALAKEPEVQAAARAAIGLTYMSLGSYDAAEPQLREALATRERVLGSVDPDVASSLVDLGTLEWRKGDYAASEPLFQRALAIQKAAPGAESDVVALDALNNLGQLYKDQGKYAEAEPFCREALELRKRRFGARDPEVAISLGNLASLLLSQGKLAEAESCCREALDIRAAAFGENHPDVALSLNNLATVLEAEARYAEAEPVVRRSLAVARAVYGDAHPAVAATMGNLATILSREGSEAGAEAIYRDVLAMTRKELGDGHPAVAGAISNLASSLEFQGRLAEAEPLYRETLAMRRNLFGAEHPAIAMSLNNLATVLQEEGRLAEAEPLYRDALVMRRKLLGNAHPHVANTLLGLAEVRLRRGAPGEAETMLAECLAIRMKADRPDTLQIAAVRNAMGACYVSQHRYAPAESLLVTSTELLIGSPGISVPRKREAIARMVALYEGWGRPQQAERYRSKMAGI